MALKSFDVHKCPVKNTSHQRNEYGKKETIYSPYF